MKWNLDRPGNPEVTLAAREKDVELRGWVLDDAPLDLTVRDANGVRRLPLNERRPDVVRKVLGSTEADHPRAMCGFRHRVEVAGGVQVGFTNRATGETKWLTEIRVRHADTFIQCQLDPSRQLFDDRAHELAEYWNTTPDEVRQIYEDYNVTKAKTLQPFRTESLEAIIDSYLDPPRVRGELARMMLHYHRLGTAFEVVDAIDRLVPESERSRTRVLDYGCGAGDYALAFALRGYQPALCDLAGGKLELARFRLERRGFDVTLHPATKEVEYPDVDPPVQVIVTSELLEHLRSPLRCLRKMHGYLSPGGHLWFSDFPNKSKRVGGDHLQSAADERLACQAFIREAFEPVDGAPVENLYRKR